MKKLFNAILVVLVFSFAVAVYAAGDKTSDESKLSKEDETFIKEAAQGGQMEVRLGQVAKKAVHEPVKAFGKRMTEDHSKANKELAALAKKKSVALSKSLEGKYKSEVDRLAKLSGDEFDREYMKAMVKDHQEDVEKFEQAAKNAKDSEVKGFASKQLPILKEHLELAQKTEKELSQSRTGKNK
jgi:putative membrane protein